MTGFVLCCDSKKVLIKNSERVLPSFERLRMPSPRHFASVRIFKNRLTVVYKGGEIWR